MKKRLHTSKVKHTKQSERKESLCQTEERISQQLFIYSSNIYWLC